MRILLVSEDIPHPQLGGLGRHVLALADELHRRGHKVTLLGQAEGPAQGLDDQRGPGRFIADIRGHVRGWGQARLGVYPAWGWRWRAQALASAIVRHAAGHDLVHYHGHLPWVGALLPSTLPFTQTRHDQGGDCARSTRVTPAGRRCDSRDPVDCAACATPHPNAAQRWISTHGVRWMRNATERACRASPPVFVSGFLRDQQARVAPAAAPGVVIHNAADRTALQRIVDQRSTSVASTGDGVHRIVCAGALFDYKGVGPWLDALAARGLPPGWQVTVVGDGPERPVLQQRHGGAGVQFTGWRSHDDTLALLAAAHAVVLPSLCDEPCSTVVLEALALGRVVHALRRGGTPELARWAGPDAAQRLRLHDDLPDLVDSLLAGGDETQPPDQALSRFEGDVAAMVDRLLVHHARVIERHRQGVR